MSLSYVTRLLQKIKALIGGKRLKENDSQTSLCVWCENPRDNEHQELKEVIAELTHNWGLERNMLVKSIKRQKDEIAELKVQLNECKK